MVRYGPRLDADALTVVFDTSFPVLNSLAELAVLRGGPR